MTHARRLSHSATKLRQTVINDQPRGVSDIAKTLQIVQLENGVPTVSCGHVSYSDVCLCLHSVVQIHTSFVRAVLSQVTIHLEKMSDINYL